MHRARAYPRSGGRRWMAWVATWVAVGGLLVGATPALSASLIANGDFEADGGSFAHWTVLNQPGRFGGNWFIQSGTLSPTSGFVVPPPPGPTHAAMTDQLGVGSHILYQDFVVPTGVASGSISFDVFIGKRKGTFFPPASLNALGVFPNQQARVDIMTTTAPPFSEAAGDVLLTLFQTQVGDPAVSGYTTSTTDLTALLQAHGGETLRLRFTEEDNQFYFQMGVDRVDLAATTVPEPSATLLLAISLAGLLAYGWRRQQAR